MALYRSTPDPALRLRAQIILLLADGHPWALIAAVLFCSTATISRWKRRFEAGGVESLAGEPRGRKARLCPAWAATALGWVRHRFPSDYGFLRSRWGCGTVVVLLVELHHVQVGVETVRRWLREGGLVWRRPRPVLGPRDPLYEAKVAQIRLVLASAPASEAIVFTDEVDINTNPKIGCAWMPRASRRACSRPAPTPSVTWPAASTGGPARSSSPPGADATGSCSSPTSRSCATASGGTGRST
jgi:transposase